MVAPLSKLPQTSNVVESKAGLEAKATLSLVRNRAGPSCRTRLSTAACETITPFGCPVEPEVYMT